MATTIKIIKSSLRAIKGVPRSSQDPWIEALSCQILGIFCSPDQEKAGGHGIPPGLTSQVFHCLAKCFLEDVHLICSSSNPDSLLIEYLQHGRGWRLLGVMRILEDSKSSLCQDLSVLLLSLAVLLRQKCGVESSECQSQTSFKKVFDIPESEFNSENGAVIESILKKKHNDAGHRNQNKLRFRRKPRTRSSGASGFPDSGNDNFLQPRTVIENLVEFEKSDSEDCGSRENRSTAINFDDSRDGFHYYNHGSVDSDDCHLETGIDLSELSICKMKNISEEHVSLSDLYQLILLVLTKLTKRFDTAQQTIVMQIAGITTAQIQVCDEKDNVSRCLLLRLLLNCIENLRFRPDIVDFIQEHRIHTVLARLLADPKLFKLQTWVDLSSETLFIFTFFCNSQVKPMKVSDMTNPFASVLSETLRQEAKLSSTILASLVDHTLQGLEYFLTSTKGENSRSFAVSSCDATVKLLSTMVSVLEVRCEILPHDTLNRIVTLGIGLCGQTELLSLFCCVRDNLRGRGVLLALSWEEIVGKSVTVICSYLEMVEAVLENGEDSDGGALWEDGSAKGGLVGPGDSDSMLGTSPIMLYSSEECLDSKKSINQVDLGCYLSLLKSKEVLLREVTVEHLHACVSLMDEDVRYRLATQVVLPYLSLAFESAPENEAGEESERNLVNVKDVTDNQRSNVSHVKFETVTNPVDVKTVPEPKSNEMKDHRPWQPWIPEASIDHNETVINQSKSVIFQDSTEDVYIYSASMTCSMLALLSHLSSDQATAMSLISHPVWVSIKTKSSIPGHLAVDCQEVIKTMVLNSRKFRKIRLSEAEAMALCDEESDKINFDDRDRNAQFWLLKQLYHVLVQSTLPVITTQAATHSFVSNRLPHVSNAWQICFDLIKKVPDFFSFSVARGILGLNQQVTESLLRFCDETPTVDLAWLLALLVKCYVFVVVSFDESSEEFLHLDLKTIKDNLQSTFRKLTNLVDNSEDMRFRRILLSRILESSQGQDIATRVGLTFNFHNQSKESLVCGYEADASDSCSDTKSSPKETRPIVYKNSFLFFAESFIKLIEAPVLKEDLLYTIEYLILKLINTCGKNPINVKLLNDEETIFKLLSALDRLLEHPTLEPGDINRLVIILLENCASVRLTPRTIHQLFRLVASDRSSEFLKATCKMLIKDVEKEEAPSSSAIPILHRERNNSSSSHDSGLDSSCSTSRSLLNSSPQPFKAQIDVANGNLGTEFSIVMKMRLWQRDWDTSWIPLLSVESHADLVQLHVNAKKGLRMTVSNIVGTSADVETSYKVLFVSNQWTHLVINIETAQDGDGIRKTLKAFVNCSKVWDVGLHINKPQKTGGANRKKKFVTITLGPNEELSDVAEGVVYFGDVHVLKETSLSVEHVILNYLLGPVDLNSKTYHPKAINYGNLLRKFPGIASKCQDIIANKNLLSDHMLLHEMVVAHFNPSSMWSTSEISETSTTDRMTLCQERSWSLVRGVLEVGGVSSILLLPAAAIQDERSDEIIALAFRSLLQTVTNNQEVLDEFLLLGGFPLISSLLSLQGFSPGPLVLSTLINCSSSSAVVHVSANSPTGKNNTYCVDGSQLVVNISDQILFYPQLLEVVLEQTNWRFDYLPIVLCSITSFICETNPFYEFNLAVISNSNLVKVLMSCLLDLGNAQSAPVYEISSLLGCIPPNIDFLTELASVAVMLLPPSHLYLPSIEANLLTISTALHLGPATSSLISSLNKQDVLDVSSLLGQMELGDTEQKSSKECENVKLQKFLQNRKIQDMERRVIESSEYPSVSSHSPINLDYLETEEDVVEEWVVVTPKDDEFDPPCQDSLQPPPAPVQYPVLAQILSTLVSGFNLLPDSASSKLTETALAPTLIFGFVNHPSPEVHTNAINLLSLVLQRCSNTRKNLFCQEGGYKQLAGIIESGLLKMSPPTSQLVESVLCLLHNHHVSLDIVYEYSRMNPPSLNLTSVVVLLPMISTTRPAIHLCHNLLRHLHELAANIPEFLKVLHDEGLCQVLLTNLVILNSNAEIQSNVCGVLGADLLQDDIRNILRMMVVSYVDKPGNHYDMVFLLVSLAAGLSIQPQCFAVDGSVLDFSCLRNTVSSLLEDALYTLKIAMRATSRGPTASSFEMNANYRFGESGASMTQLDWSLLGSTSLQFSPAVSQSVLSARYHQIIKFSVNFLTSGDIPLIPQFNDNLMDGQEEETLARSLTLDLLEKIVSGSLMKKTLLGPSLTDQATLAGVMVLHQLNPRRPRKIRLEVARHLDTAADLVKLVANMFETMERRELFREGIHCLMLETRDKGVVEVKMVEYLYRKLMDRSLYPPGTPPTIVYPSSGINHSSFRLWQEECYRCRQVVMAQQMQEQKTAEVVAGKITERLVNHQDTINMVVLEAKRKHLGVERESKEAWINIVESQVHPNGAWHQPSKCNSSLAVDSVKGTGRKQVRLRRQHSGLTEERLFKPGFKHLAAIPEAPFSRLCNQVNAEGSLGLTERLGGLEVVENVLKCQQITSSSVDSGELILSTDKIHFLSVSTTWFLPASAVEAVSKRRYQLQDTALEVFTRTGQAHLLTFPTSSSRDIVLKHLTSKNSRLSNLGPSLSSITRLWQQGGLTNFQYLTQVNRLAGRTTNDLMQYPVFPWVLADYSSPHLDLLDPATYRDLRKPVAVQFEDCARRYLENYQVLKSGGVDPYHYAAHYSNTGIVLHFTVRLPPFTAEFIDFQDGNFDLADRSFHSLGTSWDMASRVSSSDVKELIPELFYLPEILINREGFNLGVKQNGVEVDHVELPPWATDARTFTRIHMQALESSHVRKELSHWVDLVFGHKQTGPDAVAAVNVFHPATYGGGSLEEVTDPLERQARQTMIATYGQTPVQLFDSPHPLPLESLAQEAAAHPAIDCVTGILWGNYVGSPTQPAPNVVWQQTQACVVSRLLALETCEVLGLPARTCLLGRYSGEQQLLGAFLLVEAGLVTWGHHDNTVRYRTGRLQGDVQLAVLPSWDKANTIATHPRVPSLWIGHRSGMMTVYEVVGSPVSLSVPSRLFGHTSTISSITLSPELGVALSCSLDGVLSTWDLHSHLLLHSTKISTGHIIAAISRSTGDIATITADGELALHTVNLHKIVAVRVEPRVTAIAWSRCEEGVAVNAVAAGHVTGLVRLYSGWDLAPLRDIAGCPTAPVNDIVFSEDSQNMVVATTEGTVTILEKSGSRGLNKTPRYITIQ